MGKIEDAELAIARILKQLEKDTDMVVQSVSLRTYEVTTVSDLRVQRQQRVIIETERTPGNNWPE